MAFAWFTIGVKWETKGGKQEKGREIDENSPLCEQTRMTHTSRELR